MKKFLTKFPTRYRRGDTLIEVIFAFAILGTVIGFAFTGVIAARRSAVEAQQRTQAFEIAQYQSEGLQTYRNSLENWDNTGSLCPSFLNGSCSGAGGITLDTGKYCIFANSGIWQLLDLATSSASAQCSGLAPYLHLNGPGNTISITFNKIGRLQNNGVNLGDDNQTVQATISVNWTDPFGHNQSVQNIVILTRQK